MKMRKIDRKRDDGTIVGQKNPVTMVTVDLSYRHLETLPDQLLDMEQVTHLNLRHNFLGRSRRGSSSSFSKLADMMALRWLILSQNAIRTLPTSLSLLKNLTMIDLTENNISALPNEFSALTNLKTLLLNGNNLTSLPGTFTSLHKLEVLSLGRNNLSTVPSVLESMESLKNVDLSCNMLHDITNIVCSILRHIPHLELQKNNIICNSTQRLPLDVLTGVRYLDFSFNTVSDLDLTCIDGLEHINVSHCSLRTLHLSGARLRSLRTSHNELKEIQFVTMPIHLTVVDISNNMFHGIPDWVNVEAPVTEVCASHNQLTVLPNKLFDGQMKDLKLLKLDNNQIINLPDTNGKSDLKYVYLNNNRLSSLPDSFFISHPKLTIVNLTNNRLGTINVGLINDNVQMSNLEELYLTSNYLQEDMLTFIDACTRLKVLHIAYNELHSWRQSVRLSPRLEELNLSGNQLTELPSDIKNTKLLQVLNLHANRLTHLPDLASLEKLKVLDVSNNNIGKIDLESMKFSCLLSLDISMNPNLFVDPDQFKKLCCDKSVEMVDVTCCSRVVPSFSSHVQSLYPEDVNNNHHVWTLGFSEVPGRNGRLCAGQIRMPKFHVNQAGDESALLCICDCRYNIEATKKLQTMLPETIREEKSCPETANLYMKTTILTAIKHMRSIGYASPLDILVAHISKVKSDASMNGGYVLTIGSIGRIKCILCRKGEPQVITSDEMIAGTQEKDGKKGCCTLDQDNAPIPDPSITDIPLCNKDEYLILANEALWNYISAPQAINEIGQSENPNVAAKKLVHMAIGCGCTESLSIMILKFNFMAYAKNSSHPRRSRYQQNKHGRLSHNNSPLKSSTENMLLIKKNGLGSSAPNLNYESVTADYRSSNFDLSNVTTLTKNWTSLCTFHALTDDELNDMRLGSEGDSEVSDELSGGGEAYKSWEYVLEQNHKLLFTRQLQTLHKSFKQTKHRMRSVDPGRWCNNHTAAAYGTICHYTSGAYPSYRGRYYYYNRPV